MTKKILNGKRIILFVTGSIAAYKAVIIVRLLIKSGAEVKVVMTRAAADFVSPLTFSTLSKNKVLSELFDEDTWANHVGLGRWADLILAAPASCNTIAKMANGICDNLMQAIYLSAACPVLIAPAMDEDMWNHPSTKRNIDTLRRQGNNILPVNDGELASGLTGMGRMAEPEEILDYLNDFFEWGQSLKGITALVTAGPTQEPIDPVRYIANRSTGTMGIAIAEELSTRGASVHLIVGPSIVPLPKNVVSVKVNTAREMYDACMSLIKSCQIIIMAAAVADFTPGKPSREKIKKDNDKLSLEMVKTKDILFEAGKIKAKHQTLIGFALETNNEKENALKKLKQKKADLIVLNSLNDEGAGFGIDTNRIIIFDRKGNEYKFNKKSKREVAKDIINTIITFRNA